MQANTLPDAEDFETSTANAVEQLTNHMELAIDYPETMADYGVSGEVIIQVSFNQKGELIESLIAQELDPEFDQVVLDAVRSFEALQLSTEQYSGARSFMIPVVFSLR